MNYDFLRNYSISTAQSNYYHSSDIASGPSPNQQMRPSSVDGSYMYGDTYRKGLHSAGGYNQMNYYNSNNSGESYAHSYRNVEQQYPRSAAGGFNTPPKRLLHSYEKRAPKRKYCTALEERSSEDQLFMGRDDSYPGELNVLFKPLSCELCGVHLNSTKTASIHYMSKTHDKNITSWLYRNYTERGLETPLLKRFYKDGPVGPDAFYCEHCDLKLTSKSHQEQHFSGRKHRLVVSNISKPSGAGYYNNEGKWVRTGTKATVCSDGRFGIGVAFKPNLETPANVVSACTNRPLPIQRAADPLQENGCDPKVYDSLRCDLCNINVTSKLQMLLHLDGSKHKKKLKATGEDVIDAKTGDSILDSLNDTMTPNDISMYRTPSGSFYCKACNLSMVHQSALVQHLHGKRHVRKAVEPHSVVPKIE